MRCFRVSVLVLVLAVVIAGAATESGAAPQATAAATPPANPQRPTQPASGPGSSEALFGGVISIEHTPSGQPQTDYWLFVPSDPLAGTTIPAEPFPLVIFVHAHSYSDPDAYLAWIEHLVRRGAVVLFASYQGMVDAEYRQQLLDDVRDALDTLEREDVAVDVSRVVVVGHSLGGVLALDFAASASAAGLPVPTAVMSVAPGCMTEEVACLGADLGAIPATTRILLVTEADDYDAMVPPAIERIWSGLSAVPLENRDLVQLTTDGHGKPALLAVHLQALADNEADPPDALDWYGTWKWLDALMGCAFTGDSCEYALGNTPEQRFMGTWSDGVPVAEALVSDDLE